MGDCAISDALLAGFLLVLWFYITQTNKNTHHTQGSIEWQAYIRIYSGSLLHLIIARNHLLFSEVFLDFVHFCPNFQIFCSFLPIFNIFCVFSSFFWKDPRITLISKIGPAYRYILTPPDLCSQQLFVLHSMNYFLISKTYRVLQCFCCSKITDCRSQISVDYIQ